MSRHTNARTVKIDELAEEVMKQMHEYVDLADDSMKKAVKKTATSVKKEISANAPKRTGKYAKSWTTKVTDVKSHRISAIVYQKQKGGQWRLAHLLEDGHNVTRERNGPILGHAKAYPHIENARDNGEKMLSKLIKKELSK